VFHVQHKGKTRRLTKRRSQSLCGLQRQWKEKKKGPPVLGERSNRPGKKCSEADRSFQKGKKKGGNWLSIKKGEQAIDPKEGKITGGNPVSFASMRKEKHRGKGFRR